MKVFSSLEKAMISTKMTPTNAMLKITVNKKLNGFQAMQ